MTEQELKEIVSRLRPGRETLPEKQTILGLIEEIRTLNLQVHESKRLLGEGVKWIGVDPTYQESIVMKDLTTEIRSFLSGGFEKRKNEDLPPGHYRTHGGLVAGPDSAH